MEIRIEIEIEIEIGIKIGIEIDVRGGGTPRMARPTGFGTVAGSPPRVYVDVPLGVTGGGRASTRVLHIRDGTQVCVCVC